MVRLPRWYSSMLCVSGSNPIPTLATFLPNRALMVLLFPLPVGPSSKIPTD